MLEKVTAREPDYGSVAKSLHWLIVALLIGQFTIAWTMPNIGPGTRPGGLIDLHFSLGMVILLIAVLRLLWRVAHPVPLIRDDGPLWQHRAAQATHGLLYLLLFVLPVFGWANASYRGLTVNLFGVAMLPQLLPTGSVLGEALGNIHVFTSYVLLALVGLHIAAALYHHFSLRDRVLRRILPGRS